MTGAASVSPAPLAMISAAISRTASKRSWSNDLRIRQSGLRDGLQSLSPIKPTWVVHISILKARGLPRSCGGETREHFVSGWCQMLNVTLCIWALCCAVFLTPVTGQPRTSVIDAVHKGHAVGHEQDESVDCRRSRSTGGDVNERDRSGSTPQLHARCAGMPPFFVRLLLDRGADVALHASSERQP